jgi:hypothetical protein
MQDDATRRDDMVQKPVKIWLEEDEMAGLVVRVSPDEVHVSLTRNGGETVVWSCDDGEAQIVFEGPSPFRSKRFDSPQGGFVGSGLPVRGEPKKHYKYKVLVSRTGDNRKYLVDPEVVVDNGTAS